MRLTCIDCSRLAGCRDAPSTPYGLYQHYCDAWDPTHPSVTTARERAIDSYGLAAIRGFSKEKHMAYDINQITSLVEEGNTTELEKLRTDASTQPTVLMLAASRLTGNSQAIAAELRQIKDPQAKRDYLTDVIIAAATSAAKAAEKAEAAPEAQEAPPKPKRKPRRKKAAEPSDAAEVSAAKEAERIAAAKAAEKADDEKLMEALSARGPNPNIDVLEAVAGLHATVHSIGELVKQIGKDLDAVSERVDALQNTCTSNAKNVEAVGSETARVGRNLTRVKAAFEGFEMELIGSGTLGDTPFAANCTDWE